MLSINTNLSSLIAQNSLNASTFSLNQAIERMSTGCKINHAGDNAANYSISTNMSTKLSSFEVAQDNVAAGMNMVETASESLDLVANHLSRIRDLTIQASNGTYGEESLKAINSEIVSRTDEISRIMANTEYNGIKLLSCGGDPSGGHGVTGSFLAPVTQLTEDEAIAQGYTIIKTADELQAMEDDLGGKYILMNDIDLSGYDWSPIGDSSSNGFHGEINGNGHVIKNLTINEPTKNYVGLIGYTNDTTIIQNLGIENANLNGRISVGILIGEEGSYYPNTLKNVYVQGTVNGVECVGGIVGSISHAEYGTMENCYADVISDGNNIGSIAGRTQDSTYNIDNVYYNHDKNDEAVYQCWNLVRGVVIAVTSSELATLVIPPTSGGEEEVDLQVGINSDESSRIGFKLGINLGNVSFQYADSESARSALPTIDEMLAKISEKQTELGAVQNRLDSAAESISVSIENLTKSRSTLRDADIAKESSEYIKAQILQEASATLLATANQSPAIALQLI